MTPIRPGMGTENAGHLLAALVLALRPELVVEIGAGDSTLALARAVQQAERDFAADAALVASGKWSERGALLYPPALASGYKPRLVTVDDFSGEGSSAELAWKELRAGVGDTSFVSFVEADFFRLTDEQLDSWGEIDLLWVDAGTPTEDVRFLARLWPRLRPGGVLCLHEPMMTTTVDTPEGNTVRTVRSPVWEEIGARFDGSYEFLTVPERHKYRQTGIGIVRKRPPAERVHRPAAFQQEMTELGEAPIRFETTGIGGAHLDRDRAARSLLAVMGDPATRAVYAHICAGATAQAQLAERLGRPPRDIGRAVNRLVAAGLVLADADGLRENPRAWEAAQDTGGRRYRFLTDRELEQPGHLRSIARQFRSGVEYEEPYVSEVCRGFTEDFARLRRRLVDEGLLLRVGGRYRRAE
ncbi:DUF2087 domain-containing protein [Streptomyces sp. SP18CS02]|uniref:DUF2087 domain-containing protein n=1 Tax=Streptomyces sp. SP18CS02 TaxID=3002531 RepID=UPI002E76ECC6|nr:DUF2087 domain-containing protein [Streptomyces sp. SP18CS02]MEE1751534.1 class I SAM-dependent methyltransferase [Streptomyces sp. SP18CS02]